ncbi:MAG TPA: apolipoprotein N-acyltransferase [Beijerinckiaceae bacterium]|nr:apolipoprotein N-acyltransferase [Beijerinckiaceae bacterium]
MVPLVRRVILSYGWERRLIAFGAGALGVLALQPFGFIPAFVVPMTVAVWLLDGCSGKRAEAGPRALAGDLMQAAEAGWWLGFGYFVAGLWWLGAAFLVDAAAFAWAMPLAIVGLPAFLALFTAFGFAVARLLWSSGGARVLALAAGLGLSEWLRGHVLTGFPWNAFGMALGGTPLLAQSAALFGLYGLTAVAVALFASPALLADRWAGRDGAPGLTLALIGWIALVGFGQFRLMNAHVQFAPGVRLRIMQPNTPEGDSFEPQNGKKILSGYLALSDRATSPKRQGLADVTDLIWPESPFPFILSRDPPALDQIAHALAPGAFLITGAARVETGAPGRRQRRYFNSIQVVGDGARVLDTYDKVHLVPFGEYLPFEFFLKRLGLRRFVQIPGGFTAGRRRTLLSVPGLPPVLPLICYEAIFPIEQAYHGAAGVRPGLLLNVTNDGWFGQTIGPYQHFAQARLRAIEEGLPLVRAANSGISAIVDPYGRTLTQLPLGVADVLDGRLPQRIKTPFFAKHPILTPILVWLAFIAGSVLLKRRR